MLYLKFLNFLLNESIARHSHISCKLYVVSYFCKISDSQQRHEEELSKLQEKLQSLSDGHDDSCQSEEQIDSTPNSGDFSTNGEKQEVDSKQTLDKSEHSETSKEKLREILNRELSVFCDKMCSSRTGDVSKEQETNERHEVAEGYEGNVEHEEDVETDGKELGAGTANHKSGDETIAEEVDNLKRKLTDDLIGLLCLNEGKIRSVFQGHLCDTYTSMLPIQTVHLVSEKPEFSLSHVIQN